MRIIDSHCHIKDEMSVQELLYQMKQNNIEKSLLISWPFWKTSDNNALLKISKQHPQLSVIGSIKLTGNKKLKSELNVLSALADTRKIAGIKIYTGYEHIFANDKLCYKVADICMKAKMPLLFHSGDCWSGMEKSKVRFAHPLYIDDIAVDFSELNIIICHFGNPWLMDTAEVLYKNKNVYADLSALDVNKPWDSAQERMMEAIEFSQAPDRLLFGTDFPLFSAADQVKRIKSLGLSKQDTELTFHGNAEKLFRI